MTNPELIFYHVALVVTIIVLHIGKGKIEEMKEVYDVAEKYFHEVIERENRG